MEKLNLFSWIFMLIGAIVLLTYVSASEKSMEELQQGIASEIIRFHVRANSDSDEDQKLKMQVKEAVVEYMGELLGDADNRKEAKIILNNHIEDIKNVAKDVITEADKEYNIKAYFEETYFPIKSYGDITFPAGTYEAFRIDIGNAEGKNWWCVLYPKLCFVDISYGVVPDDSKKELETVLDEEELTLIMPQTDKNKYVYKFKIWEFITELFK